MALVEKLDIERMEKEKDIQGLIDALGKVEDEEVRNTVSSALGFMAENYPEENNTEVISLMLDALNSKNWRIREGIVSAFNSLAFDITDPRVLPALLPLIDDKALQVRVAIPHALIHLIPEEEIDPLLKLLEDEHADVRYQAASAIIYLREIKAIEPQIKANLVLLKDASPHERASAADGLGNLKSENAVLPLIKALDDEDHMVRFSAAYALGEIGDPRAVEGLVKLLSKDAIDIKWAVIDALGKIESPRSNEMLCSLLHNKNLLNDDSLIVEAIEALGKMGDQSSLDSLSKLQDDDAEEEEIRAAAEKAIKMIEATS